MKDKKAFPERTMPAAKTGEQSLPMTIGFSPNSNSSIVDVKNGRIVRIRPLHFDWRYDPQQFNPWKMEVRGTVFEPGMKTLIPPYSLAYKKRVYSPNRILYPMKRVDWNPDGERHTEKRGESKYERISWDEAIDIIVKEIKRIHKQYGPYGLLLQADGHCETKNVHTAHGCETRLLRMLGGYTIQTRNPDSWEGFYWGSKHVWGMEPVGQMGPCENVMLDIAENTQLLLFWGADPETTPWAFNGQMASRLCYWWAELGIKQVYICPDVNYGCAIHADKWIPILPNTDAAMRLAVAYVWIQEGLYDKEYVAKHTYGFDKFFEYVTGKEDGIPKTPEWASQKCGVPEWTIKALARDWASQRTTLPHSNGGPGIRGAFSTETGRLEVLLLAMQGLGKPGVHQIKMFEWQIHDRMPMPRWSMRPDLSSTTRGEIVSLVWDTRTGVPHMSMGTGLKPGTIYPKQFIPKNLIPDAILNPPISWYGTTLLNADVEDQFVKYTYPAEGCSEVHMIWTDTPCWITCWNDTNTYIKALRSPKIEFILAQHPWMENDCTFADIVLPVNTKFELEDILADLGNGQFGILMHQEKCIPPVGEAKSDWEICCLIAEKFGLLKEFSEGRTVKDWIRFGFENSGVQKLISFEEWDQKKYFVIPTDPDWKKYPRGLINFYEDPENNPLKTPSGKVEFYSQNLAKHFPDDMERPPVPHWVERSDEHDDRLSSERAKKYPLLLMSNHGRWRVHAQCDDISWTREAPTCKIKGPDGYYYEPLWIHPRDAGHRKINNGDIIQVFNERGAVLGGAYVTERIMPGVVYMDHGARYDPIVPGELDRGGAINTITPHYTTSKNATGMVCSGFLVEVAMANLEGLRRKYPGAFKRPYKAGAGLRLERYVKSP